MQYESANPIFPINANAGGDTHHDIYEEYDADSDDIISSTFTF